MQAFGPAAARHGAAGVLVNNNDFVVLHNVMHIALGCVIRGDTAHFDFVAGEAARGIADAARDTGVPVIFGVLTTENVEQAVERASPARMDKGGEAMEAALEMALVLTAIDSP